MTADHCLGGWANGHKYDATGDSLLPHYSFYWHYESPNCDNTNIEPSKYSTVGAKLIANNPISDFALLELQQDPRLLNNINIFPYYLGWDRTGNPGKGGIGIHHPKGDVKKISIDKHSLKNMSSKIRWSDGTTSIPNTHWKSVIDKGTQEGGSSGSPVLNFNHKVIGQLHGGNGGCAPVKKYYGKFSVSWTGNNNPDKRRRLKDWLDPNNTGVSVLDGYDSYPTISGSSTICNEETYTIQNLPEGATVEWSVSNPNLVQINNNGVLRTTSYNNNYPMTDIEVIADIQMANNTIQIKKTVTLGRPDFDIIVNSDCSGYGTMISLSPKHPSLYDKNLDFYLHYSELDGSNYTPIGNFYNCTFYNVLAFADFPHSGKYKFWLGIGGYECYPSLLITKEIEVGDGGFYNDYFSLSPNPATDVVTLSFEQDNNRFRTFSTAKTTKEKYKIQLWNSLGLVKEVVTDQKEYRLSLHGIPAGFYYVHIIKGKQVIRKQLIIK